MDNLLSFKFWFNIRAGELTPLFQKLLLIFCLILAISFVIFLLLKKYRKGVYSKIWDRLSSYSITNTIFGVILLFFTYEKIPFLSARFWFLIWTLEIIIWLSFIIKKIIEIPKKKELLEKEKEFRKYLP